MVNSKKMNKSTVAVIVLALLLVLSLVLTATGAWFTAQDDAEQAITVQKFGYVGIKIEAAKGASGVYSDNILEKNAEGKWVLDADANEKGGLGEISTAPLMPGDVIKSGTYTITNTLEKNEYVGDDAEAVAEDVYYLVKAADGKFYTVDNAKQELVEVKLAEDAPEGTQLEAGFLAVDGTATWVGGADVLVDPETPNAKQGTEYAAVQSSYEVAAIQARNLTAAQAYELLVGLFA